MLPWRTAAGGLLFCSIGLAIHPIIAKISCILCTFHCVKCGCLVHVRSDLSSWLEEVLWTSVDFSMTVGLRRAVWHERFVSFNKRVVVERAAVYNHTKNASISLFFGNTALLENRKHAWNCYDNSVFIPEASCLLHVTMCRMLNERNTEQQCEL